jgi:DNA repair exonuclease SbcCD ATPase subunit
MNASLMELTGGKTKAELNDWKLRYFNDTESRDKEIEELKKRLAEAEENANIFSIEEEEMRKLYKKVKTETEGLQQKNNPGETQHSIEQLRKAQESLLEHNNKITELLNQIDIVKESEAKQEELTGINEKLSAEIEELKLQLYKKKKRSIRRGRNRN